MAVEVYDVADVADVAVEMQALSKEIVATINSMGCVASWMVCVGAMVERSSWAEDSAGAAGGGVVA